MDSSPFFTNEQLLQLFREGSEDAFTKLYERNWKRLFVIASRILEDEMAAKDVVQDVFVSFYERAAGADIVFVAAYLTQATRLRCFMQLRDGKITERHLARLSRVCSTNDTEELLSVKELDEFLKKQIDLLPDKCKEVFYLSRFELLSNQKIAQRLNISPKTVENQITKAIKVLRTSVEKIAVLVIFLFI